MNKFLLGYKLIKEYPFQKKGDIARKHGNIFLFQNGQKIEEKLLQSSFFEPVYFDFKINDIVYIKEGKKLVSGIISKNINERGYVQLKFINSKPKLKEVYYEKIFSSISYYFFNSMLVVCQEYVSSNKKLEIMEERAKLGNYFETKEECQEAVLLIKKKLELLLEK